MEVLVVEGFAEQAGSHAMQLNLLIIEDHFHVVDVSLVLLMLLAEHLRHLVVLSHAEVKAIHCCLVVSGVVLAIHLPERVASQSQHQSGYLTVVLWLHPLTSVQCESSELDARLHNPRQVGWSREGAARLRLHAVPCRPRRDACFL